MIKNSLAQLKRRLQKEDVYFDYDREVDVAYFSLGAPQPAVSSYLIDDAWVRYSPDSGEIVGFTVLDIEKAFLPHHQDLSPWADQILTWGVSREDQQLALRGIMFKFAALVETVGWTPPSQVDSFTYLLRTMRPRLQTVWGRFIDEWHWTGTVSRQPLPGLPMRGATRRLAWAVVAVLMISVIVVVLSPTGNTELTGAATGEAGTTLTVVIIILTLLAVLAGIWFVSRRR